MMMNAHESGKRNVIHVFPFFQTATPMAIVGYRRVLVLAALLLFLYILAVVHFGIASPTLRAFNPGAYYNYSSSICSVGLPSEHDKSTAVLGRPTARFRDNLRNETHYITSWAVAGFTNQFMNHANMIYLALLTNRIPIVAPFTPTSHIDVDPGMLSFGDVYDLEYLRQKLQIPILEWRDVKILPDAHDLHPSSEVEDIGCWTTTPENRKGVPEPARLVQYLGIDASYTRLPISTRLAGADPQEEIFVVFSQLAATIFPDKPVVRAEKLKVLQASREHKHNKTPDGRVACFESLYYASSGVRAFEWEQSWSPAWQTVGKHLVYTDRMKQLGREYLRLAFDLEGSEAEVPPFIAVHIRHGDFRSHCTDDTDKEVVDCFQPIASYVDHVEAIKRKWLEKSNLTVNNVIVMSDDESPAFWDDVSKLGWSFTNHTEEQTGERLGQWYPTIIDTVIQSLAVGHVGTTSSTFTLVGAKRVSDWNGGFTSDLRSWVSK